MSAPPDAAPAPPPGAAPDPAILTTEERRVTWLMACVQFVSVLSFMIVMPLGPDFTLALGIDPSLVGWITASYTLTAAASGLTAALFLDRFDRRPALAVAMGGLVLCNVAAGLADSLEGLIAARGLAGLFGGPAAALAIAIVADNVPLARRGRAMGQVMGALSVSAVVGVPLGLELANIAGWRAAFFAVALLGGVIIAAALWRLAPQRSHLAEALADGGFNPGHALIRMVRIATRATSLLALALSAAAILPGFLVITNMAVFAQFNLGFPREQLGLLYMIGGTVSFVGMQVTGRLVDRFGSSLITLVTTLALAALLWLLYYDWAYFALPVMLLVPLFMLFNTARMVAQNTAVSKVPAPAERAGFMALVQATTQVFAGMGSMIGAAMLETASDGRLENMPAVAALAIGIGLAGPPLMYALERRLPKDAPASHRVKAATAKTSHPG